MVNYGFGYGIDLAANLNYASIICLELKEKVRFAKSEQLESSKTFLIQKSKI